MPKRGDRARSRQAHWFHRWIVIPVTGLVLAGLASAVTWWICYLAGLHSQIAVDVAAIVAALVMAAYGLAVGLGRRRETGQATPVASRRYVSGAIPREAVAFQHRTPLMDRLAESQPPAEPVPPVSVVTGPRGIGKTQLAAAYARSRVVAGWPVAWWVRADTEARLVAGLAELADAAGLPNRGDDLVASARRAIRWIATYPGPCLLVFDNARDPDTVGRWLPSVGRVQVVVTSTRQALAGVGRPVRVEVFTPDEAATYLQQASGGSGTEGDTQDEADLAAVAEQLGRLPLALAQAAAVTGPGRGCPTWREYLRRLYDVDIAKRLVPVPGDPYPHGVAEAVLLSLEELSARDPVGVVRALLDLLSVMSPGGVARWLLAAAATGGDLFGEPESERRVPDHLTEELDQAIAVLVDSSLVTIADGGVSVTVHRLVARVVRESRPRGALMTTVRRGAALLDRVKLPKKEALRQRRRGHHLIEQIEALWDVGVKSRAFPIVDLMLTASLLDLQRWVVRFLGATGDDPPRALSIAEASLVEYQRRFGGRRQQDWLILKQDVALAYRHAGRHEEAITAYRDSLPVAEMVWGKGDIRVFLWRNHLGQAHLEAGKPDEAIVLYRQNLVRQLAAIKGITTRISPAHRSIVHTYHSLAAAYLVSGRYEQAISMHRVVYDLVGMLVGGRHPSALLERNNLAEACLRAGRHAEAIRHFKENLADYEQVVGDTDTRTLHARVNLATAYQVVGGNDDALALARQALAGCQALLGDSNPTTERYRQVVETFAAQAGRQRWRRPWRLLGRP